MNSFSMDFQAWTDNARLRVYLALNGNNMETALTIGGQANLERKKQNKLNYPSNWFLFDIYISRKEGGQG